MRKFSHFFTFSPTVGIRYRATVGVGESTFIPLTRHPKRIVNTPVTKATNLLSVFSLLSFSLLFSAIATTLPFLVLSLLFAAFPSRAALSPPPLTQSYSRAVIKNISTPSSRFFSFLPFAIQTCTQFSVAPFLLPPIIPQAGRSGAKCDLNARKSGR